MKWKPLESMLNYDHNAGNGPFNLKILGVVRLRRGDVSVTFWFQATPPLLYKILDPPWHRTVTRREGRLSQLRPKRSEKLWNFLRLCLCKPKSGEGYSKTLVHWAYIPPCLQLLARIQMVLWQFHRKLCTASTKWNLAIAVVDCARTIMKKRANRVNAQENVQLWTAWMAWVTVPRAWMAWVGMHGWQCMPRVWVAVLKVGFFTLGTNKPRWPSSRVHAAGKVATF